MERVTVIKILGVWIQEDLKWDTQVRQVCKKAYSRINILCKLKYAGMDQKDLLDIYKLFLSSVCEYCSAVYHTSLTQDQVHKIESIQSTSLKIILSDKYRSYEDALNKCSLQSLSERRQEHMTKFAVKCVNDKFNSKMFPKSDRPRGKDVYNVNFARTSQYLKSTIPQCQRLLNIHSK